MSRRRRLDATIEVLNEMSETPGVLKLPKLQELYCSEVHDIVREFFVPCLQNCDSYDRAAGYFSTSALRTWTGGVSNLVGSRHVHIRLLISPELMESDWRALKAATDPDERLKLFEHGIDDFVRRALAWSSSIEPTVHELTGLLAWLIASNRLEIRFAFNLCAGEERGIFHKKIGLFGFPGGEQVAFTGSANESWSGHAVNSESVDVFCSWHPSDNKRVTLKRDEFERCWNPDPKNLLVREISPVLLEEIKQYAKDHPSGGPREKAPKRYSLEEECFGPLWKHQKQACDTMLLKRHGILEMATGTGKTRTSLALVRYLIMSGRIESAVFSMAGNDLLRQWEEDIRKNLTSLTGVSLLCAYAEYREEERFLLNPTRKVLLCSRENLQRVVRQLSKTGRHPKMALVHDEVHDLGSLGNRSGLAGHSRFFEYRVGLSATPERDFDNDGNDFIEQEIGPVVFEFSLEHAIKSRVLCPFDYTVIPYRLTSEDKQDLKAVHAREAAAAKAGSPWPPHQKLIELSRVYKKARQKPIVFANHLVHHGPSSIMNSVLFVEDKDFAEAVYPTIIQYSHRFSQYFDIDPTKILEDFAAGRMDCLITCHKLSQGIDLPKLKNIVLFASQRGRRETIQRLGRCLRKDPSNLGKVAHVLDFRRVGDDGEIVQEGFDEERISWLTELSKLRPDSD